MTDPIVAYLEQHLDDYLADLRTLVAIDSGSNDKGGVDAVTGWLAERLEALGFTVEWRRQERFGDDLVARRSGAGRSRVMLLGHADTVYLGGTAAARPMTAAGDKILGPGTCDMKAGLVTGLYALRALHHVGWAGNDATTFLVVSDEEIGERHSVPLLKAEGPAHDAILTLEAARDSGDIVTARKAVRWYTVEARGRAAHAGVEPDKGRSATLAIARFVDAAYALNGMREGMTVNPGRVSGGGSPSIVADRATARFDLRARTDAQLDELEAAFNDLASRPLVPGVAFSATLEKGSGCPAMERTEGVARLEALAIGVARDLGFGLDGAATGGGSDISFAAHAGTPGLDGLGPIGGLDHGPDEYILRGSIVPRTALLAKLLVTIEAERQRGAGNG